MKIAPGESNVRLGLPVISDAAHTGLGITEDDWNVSVRHVVETLDKFKGPDKGKNEVLGDLWPEGRYRGSLGGGVGWTRSGLSAAIAPRS